MKIINSAVIAAAIALASPAFAQTATPTVVPATIDCDDPENAEEEVCLALPPSTVTNFAPVVAAVGGLIALGALSGGGGGATSTTTTSTGTP